MDKISSTEYNLLSEPWIPVQRRSGRKEWIRPSEVTDQLKQDPVVSVAWSRVDFNRATLEFFIGLFTTITLIEDEDGWIELWDSPPDEEDLNEKLEQYKIAFSLDGPNARFMQDFDALQAASVKPTGELFMGYPGEQTLKKNSDHFVKRGSINTLSRASAAIALFTLQSYAPSGGSGHRTSLRGGGPLTTLTSMKHQRYGDTLWGKIWPNVETIEQLRDRNSSDSISVSDSDSSLIFPWLAPTRTSDTKTGLVTSGNNIDPRQVYWGMPRRIRLNFTEADNQICSVSSNYDDIVVTSYQTSNYGTNYSSESIRHPLSPYYEDSKKNLLPKHAMSSGLTYKDWPGILFGSTVGNTHPAKCVERAIRRATDNKLGNLEYLVFGYDMENMKALGFLDSVQSILLGSKTVNEVVLVSIDQLARASKYVADQLTSGVKSAFYEQPKTVRGDWSKISRNFYQETESKFKHLVEEMHYQVQNTSTPEPNLSNTLDHRRQWLQTLRYETLRLFDREVSTITSDTNHIERYAKARFNLQMILSGKGNKGKVLYESHLNIPLPS